MEVVRTIHASKLVVRTHRCACGSAFESTEKVTRRIATGSARVAHGYPAGDIKPATGSLPVACGGVGGALPSGLFPVSGSSLIGSLEASGSEVVRKIRKKAESLPGFDKFYAEYPRKVARPHALAMWKREGCEEIAATVLLGLRIHLPDLTSRPRDKVPHPATFITGRRWEDEPEPIAAPSVNGTRPAASQQRIAVGMEWLASKQTGGAK